MSENSNLVGLLDASTSDDAEPATATAAFGYVAQLTSNDANAKRILEDDNVMGKLMAQITDGSSGERDGVLLFPARVATLPLCVAAVPPPPAACGAGAA